MQGAFFNCLLSAVVGAASSVGVTWYLSSHSSPSTEPTGAAPVPTERLEVGELVVRDRITLSSPDAESPSLEIRDGTIYAQNGLYAENIGAYNIVSQKFLATPDDPLVPRSAAIGEFAVDQDGGAYLELTSPRESHTVTIGFDRNEKGCVLSKNNNDRSLVAQAIFLKPDASDASKSTSATELAQASSQTQPGADATQATQSGTETVGTSSEPSAGVASAPTTTTLN